MSSASSTLSIALDVTVDRSSTKEVLRALLHAILFHRLFGTVTPRTVDVLDVTFPGVADPDIERLVNEKVDVFWRALEGPTMSGRMPKRGQLIVTMSEKRQKKTWFSMGEEEVPWEIWTVNVTVHSPQSESERREILGRLPQSLSETLLRILTHVSSEKSRSCVPPMSNASLSPFPMRISVKVGTLDL